MSEQENQPDPIAQARNFIADCRFSDEFVGNVSRSRLLPFFIAELQSERVARQAAETERDGLAVEQRKLREMFEGVAELIDAHFWVPNDLTDAERLRQASAEIRDTLADTYAPLPTATEQGAVAEAQRLREALALAEDQNIDTLNAIVECSDPDMWDGDEAIDDIAIRYVRWLESLVGSPPSTERGRAAVIAPFEEGGGSGSGQDAVIWIRFDGTRSHEAPRFIGTQDSEGHGVGCFEWRDNADGTWSLGSDFWNRYHTDVLVFNLANAVLRLHERVVAFESEEAPTP